MINKPSASVLSPGRGPILLIAAALVCSSTIRLFSQRATSQPAPSASGPTSAPVPSSQGLAASQPATSDAPPNHPVLRVRSLADTGPGEKLIPWTLRWALDAVAGPRSIRFETGGVINLKQPLYLRDPFVHIDGRTTDGRGITIQRSQFGVTNTHDVLIEYMRFRAGDGFASKDELWRDHKMPDSGGWRSLLVIGTPNQPARDVTIRYCSIQNSSDDNGCVWDACENICFVYCIFSGGYTKLNKAFLGGAEPGNPKPNHGRWMTLDHCLLAEMAARAPDLDGGIFRISNCAIVAPYQGGRLNHSRGDVIGNWLVSMRPHPWPEPDRILVEEASNAVPKSLYFADNWLDGRPADASRIIGVVNKGQTTLPNEVFSPVPLRQDPGTTEPAPKALQNVLDFAGCLPRDDHDRALLQRVRATVARTRSAEGKSP